jgi:hypothetical protein
VTRDDIARRRLRNERLVGAPFASAVDVVRWLGAVQAQDYAGAKWALGQRVRRCTDADVDAACDRGDILRTHVMRPTWHFVVPEDIRWMLVLTAPQVKARMAYYDRQLALDGPTYARTNAAIARALEGGRHLTREELGKALAAAGVAASGQRLGHIVLRAELDALVCSGPRRGKQFTYALLDERVPPTAPVARDEALATLARRYFTSHGPAQVIDFAWWSGLTVADAKAGVAMLASDLVHADVDGKRYWLAPSRMPAKLASPVVHLLPNYDELLVAYKDHRASVDPALTRGLGPRDAVFANHLVVIDGVVVGGWRRLPGKRGMGVAPTLLRSLSAVEKAALARACEAYGRFLAMPVTMTPPRRAGAKARHAPSIGRARARAR